MNRRIRRPWVTHYIQAIDISAFCRVEEFFERTDELVLDLKRQPTAEGVKEILLPGEPEWRIKQKRQEEGCPIRREDVSMLAFPGGDFGAPFPRG
ncbi:MAG: Ldh family oxidoreductase [Syntrophaceae bacterium]|nr:Ldh family oxidoreductase [Syntrophaceae bacterium]